MCLFRNKKVISNHFHQVGRHCTDTTLAASAEDGWRTQPGRHGTRLLNFDPARARVSAMSTNPQSGTSDIASSWTVGDSSVSWWWWGGGGRRRVVGYLWHGPSMSETVETRVCREHVCMSRSTGRRISVVFLFRWFSICVSAIVLLFRIHEVLK